MMRKRERSNDGKGAPNTTSATVPSPRRGASTGRSRTIQQAEDSTESFEFDAER